MKKSNLSYGTHLLRIAAILCLLSSYLWIAPNQVHALSVGSQGYYALGEEQTYVTVGATTDNRMAYYDRWKSGYEAGLLNPVVFASAKEQTQPQTFALSLEDYLWSTEPLQTDKLSLSISKGDVSQIPGESNPSAPVLDSSTTLTVSIISSPWATVDNNLQPLGDAGLPGVFVVEAVITNTGGTTATGVVVTLDYNEDPSNGWILLAGEDPVRKLDELAPGAAYYAYWFARYPNDAKPEDILVPSHQYTVTAEAANASSVATAENFYDPNPDRTVQIRSTQNTGNSGLIQTSAEIVVGFAFTVTVEYDLGTGPDDAIFSPVGNDDFDPGAYRLLASQVRFYDDGETQESIVTNRLYFPTVPKLPDNSSPDKAEATFTFIAVLPSNTTLCPYAALNFSPNPKYDENFCSAKNGGVIPITGTLTLSQTKQVSSDTIEQGQWLTYTIHYTNTGNKALQYAWIWDDVPTDTVSIVTDSIDPDPTLTTDSRIAWNPGTIPAEGQAGSTDTLTFAVLVDGNGDDLPDNTDVVNTAFFGIVPPGGSLADKIALTSTVSTIVEAPMIALSKTDGQDTAQPGDALLYTLRITNSGSIATTGLVITEELPANVTLAGTTTPDFDHQDGQTLVWNSQDISADDTFVITVPVMVNLDVPDGTTLTNTATVIYQNTAGHTFAAKTATDTTIVQAPILTITKTAEDVDGPPLVVSDTIRYTLQVTNTGSCSASDVTVTDDLPEQVTCQGVSGDSAPDECADPLVWSIPSLAVDDTASLVITVTINPGSEGQTITNTGSLTGTNVPPVCPDGSPPNEAGECPTTPEPLDTELTITKTAEDVDGPPLVVGDEILYTLQVTNIGSYTAYNVTVTDDLPDQVTCQEVSGDSAPAGCADPLVWSIPSLAVDDTASLYITVTINLGSEGQTITNTASVTGENVPDPPDDPTPVCPDGSTPVDGICPTPEPPPSGIFLPIILKNY